MGFREKVEVTRRSLRFLFFLYAEMILYGWSGVCCCCVVVKWDLMLRCIERVLWEKVVTKGRMIVRGICVLGLGVWRGLRLGLGRG